MKNNSLIRSKAAVCLIIILVILFSCKKSISPNNTSNNDNSDFFFAKGADVSWLSQMEDNTRKPTIALNAFN